MKTSTKISSTLILSLTLLTACSKDDDGGDSATANGELTASVDGKIYESMPEATTAEENSSTGFEVITISGGSVDSENIQISIIGFESEGTYDLNGVNIATYTFLGDKTDFMSAQIFSTSNGSASNGEIKIAEYRKGERVKGTFSFTGYLTSDTSQKVVVSNGTFNVSIRD
ncbi:DUF6252 family protein [Leeuwenhoekiella marinoflava]|uniref:DUF6252 family protein n=1 Tax=Leeuwenhoekiella marinoflava TaxID=988 RepID=UPI0030018547